MISNESPVRENRTLGSMSGERKRGQGGDGGTGPKAKAVGNSYSLHPRQARLSSTLPKGGLHKPRLQGYQLIGAKYRHLRDRKRAGGALAIGSRVLNLELRFEAGRLRLWNPAAKQYLLTLKEANAALRAAEARTQAEFEACRALEERLAELEADLRATRKPHEPSD